MNRWILCFLLATSISPNLYAQTHCQQQEIDYFSCRIAKSNKMMSICGNIIDGQVVADSWVQYRFGEIGHVELAFPEKRVSPLNSFSGHEFHKYAASTLRFSTGKYNYEVSLNGRLETEKGVLIPYGEITVVSDKNKVSKKFLCQTVDEGAYGFKFMQLNAALSK